MTRILSVFNLLKRVGFAVLLLGTKISFGQDWETPIQLTNDPQWWDSNPALIVDSSLNLHVFAIRHNDSLFDSTSWIVPHELCYMKFTNWGVPLIGTTVLHVPANASAEVNGPAVTLDPNGHIHVFWFVDYWTPYVGYLMMDEFGTVLVGPDTLVIAEGQDIFGHYGATMHATVSLDGRVWATVASGFVAVTEDGVQIDSARQLHPTEVDAFWPTLAPGPDGSMWTSFRWGLSDHVSLRRLDDPFSVPFDITTHAGQYGLFIGDDGTRYLVISSDSSYLLSVSGDGLVRDSVAFAGAGFSVTRGSVLVEASNDSLVHYYTSAGGDSVATFVWFSRDTRVLRGPDRYEVPNFGGFESSLSATPSGGYWLLGVILEGQTLRNLGMLHVPGVGEPSFSPERPFIADMFSLSAYPNPFNSTLTVSLQMPYHMDISVGIYDILGREVDVIHRGRPASSTLSYTVSPTLTSGAYFVKGVATGSAVVKRVVLVK